MKNDLREFAWINTVVAFGLIIGITFIAAWVTKIIYTPTLAEVQQVVQQIEKRPVVMAFKK